MRAIDRPVPVMILVPCFGYGGLEQVVLHLAQGLDRRSFRPVLYSLVEPETGLLEQIRSSDIVFKVIEKGHGVNVALPFKLASAMRREGIRLVNSHDIGATLYAAPAAFLSGVKHVVHTEHSQILARRDRWRIFGAILRNWTSFSITVSRELESTLVEKLGLDRERVMTIQNAVEASRFSCEKFDPSTLEKLGIAEGELVVGSVGRLTEQKGYEYLLEAIAISTKKHTRLRLVMVGRGELREELELLARSLGIARNVVFAGVRRDVPKLLAAFDIFVLPSLWEGQPITLMEAMAAAKAIIATDVGDNASILGAANPPLEGSFEIGERGILVRAKDHAAIAAAVDRLAEDRSLRSALGSRAREYARLELDPATMVKRYEKVFDALLAGEAPSSGS